MTGCCIGMFLSFPRGCAFPVSAVRRKVQDQLGPEATHPHSLRREALQVRLLRVPLRHEGQPEVSRPDQARHRELLPLRALRLPLLQQDGPAAALARARAHPARPVLQVHLLLFQPGGAAGPREDPLGGAALQVRRLQLLLQAAQQPGHPQEEVPLGDARKGHWWQQCWWESWR